MGNIAIFGTTIADEYISKAIEIILKFTHKGFQVSICKALKEKLVITNQTLADIPEFKNISENDTQLIVSLGGDGTFLKCAHICYKTNIPILGINFGKLGFLAQTKPEDINFVIENIKQKNFSIRKRSLLDFSFVENGISHNDIGVNEITLQKSNAVKLIKLNIFVNEEFLCSFWADGVAISTPTGSTGYSLSLGSPILTPDNESLIITPIAPHTLSIRPIIIPNSQTIRVEACGEYTHFLISNDYLSHTVQQEPKIEIKKSKFTISTIEFNNTSFFETLREKLKLGYDIRK